MPAGAASLFGTVLALLCAVLVTARAVGAPAPVPKRSPTDAERRAIAAEIAAAEPDWEKDTAKTFPADHWSQSDDFHGHEYRKVVDVAEDAGVPIEEVLRAVDDDLHRGPHEDRRARAVPCKPRPIYD